MEQDYELKSTDVKAIQWDGKNKDEMFKFAGANTASIHNGTDLILTTHMNAFTLALGDYLVKNADGDIWFFKKVSFEKQYIPKQSTPPTE